MEILAIWFGVAIVTAIAAGARGRSPIGWFFIGLLCSFMGLIAVLVMRPMGKEAASEALPFSLDQTHYRDCPYCAEPIKKAAVKSSTAGQKSNDKQKILVMILLSPVGLSLLRPRTTLTT
ncbi:hypothetical protein [Pseudomonas sp. F3-2]|uniref:hypothetical protein n=1 Tax=Pseudomonas sp. F3-2 TaxID=3141539 RepID=UPI00315D00CC